MERPRRPPDHCPTPLPRAGPVDASPPMRPIPKCDPPIDPVLPEFRPPEPLSGEPAGVNLFPGPVAVSNLAAVTVTCASHGPAGSSGPSVTVAANAVTAEFFFQEIPLITSAELTFIAERMVSQSAAVVAALAAGNTAGLASLLNVSTAKATAAVALYAALVASVNAQAQAQAVASLTCRWGNAAVSLACSTPFPVGTFGNAVATATDSEQLAVNPAVVAANTYFSEVSQAEANALAEAAATLALVCVWKSPALTVTCADAGHPALAPGQPNLAAAGVLPAEAPGSTLTPHPEQPGRYRVNRVIMPAGAFESRESEAVARELAELAGIAALDCFYINPTTVLACTGAAATAAQKPIEYNGTELGNPVTVTAGFVASAASWADAQDQATVLAQSALECLWLNRRLTYACDDANSNPAVPLQVTAHVDSAGGAYTNAQDRAQKAGPLAYVAALEKTLQMLASPVKSRPYSYTVEAGEYASEDGQDAADALAANFALSQLNCVYCNPRINPVCVPPDSPFDIATVELPVAESLRLSTWSVDATAGVPGIVYTGLPGDAVWQANADFFNEDPQAPVKTLLCSDDPFESAALADIVGLIPISQLSPQSRNSNCQYGNDRYEAACRATDLPGGTVTATRLTPGGAFSDYYSPRSTASYIVMAADSVQANSKVQANAIAQAIVLSQLDCFFESPKMSLFCGAVPGGALPAAAAFRDVTGTLDALQLPASYPGYLPPDLVNPVSPASKGAHPLKPVPVPYGYGRSYVSPQDAYDQAVLVGVGQLDCFWVNDLRRAVCEGFELVPPHDAMEGTIEATTTTGRPPRRAFTVLAGTYRSNDSKADANNQAFLIAESQLNCLYTHPDVDGECTGAQVALQPVTLPSGIFVSNLSTADATTTATTVADSLMVCDGSPGARPSQVSSPFGISSSPGSGGGCCKIKMTPGAATDLTAVWVASSGSTSAVPRAVSVRDEAAAQDFCATATYIYLQVAVVAAESPLSPDVAWLAEDGDATIVTSTTLQDLYTLVSSGPPAIYIVRRLIGQILPGDEDDCSDLQIIQAIHAEQKVTSTVSADGLTIPIIVDRHSPTTPSPSNCYGFALSNTGSAIKVGPGSAGDRFLPATTDGTHRPYGEDIYLRITMNGTTGTYTATLESGYESTDLVNSIFIGSSTSAGLVSQGNCGGVSVYTCRDWFAGSAPFYVLYTS